ncbi:MAG: hypothetical protein EXR94_05775 [Gemmatimonadetes bacterium]|nr:hypothetical protein [Gemmatimonadota bacterium]
MILVLVLLAGQPRLPTVGDTVWISTKVPLAARQIVRAQGWNLGDIGQVLGPSEVDYVGDSAIIRYPVAFWYPGRHGVTVPGPIVVNPDGRSDTLPARPVSVEIATVLPPNVPRDSLVPREAADVLPQEERSLLPLVVLWVLVGLAATAIAGVRRVRRPAPPPAAPVAPAPSIVPVLGQWHRAGETRAAAEGWSHLIHAKLSSSAPDQTGQALGRALDAIGFQSGALPPEAEQLVVDAAAWVAAQDLG